MTVRSPTPKPPKKSARAVSAAKAKPEATIAGPRVQVAALALKQLRGHWCVLLVTSRETRRWVIPKGWTMKSRTNPQAAAIEARQEAGLLGTVHPEPIGRYSYFKRLPGRFQPCVVEVYRMDVTDQLLDWPERRQRRQSWFPLNEAAGLVDEPELAELMREMAAELG